MNENPRQRSGDSGPRKRRKRRNAREKQAENARSRRNSAREERQELYLRWRDESFDLETGQFIGDFREFQDFYEVWTVHDYAEDLEQDATGKPSTLLNGRQSPLGNGHPSTKTDVSVSDVVVKRRPAQELVAVSTFSKSYDDEMSPKGNSRNGSCATVLLKTFINCILIVAVITVIVMFWSFIAKPT